MDPWYSLGKADMLDVAFMGLHVGQLSSRARIWHGVLMQLHQTRQL